MLTTKNIFISESRKLIWISFGSILGALIRWNSGETIFVNTLGAFVLGCMYANPFDKRIKLLIGIGFCGSLTTFSGWIIEVYKFINSWLNFGDSNFLYKGLELVCLTFFTGLIAFFAGLLITKRLRRLKLFR